MYWKGMRSTIRSLTKPCRSCQVNKKWHLKYGHLPSKIVITVPWQALCVDLTGPYTLKGKDGPVIDFMALTMIDPATSWFKIVELPLLRRVKSIIVNGKESSIIEDIFDKTSERIARLVNKTWLSRYPKCCYIIYNNGSESKLHFEYLCETYGIQRKPATSEGTAYKYFLSDLYQPFASAYNTAKQTSSTQFVTLFALCKQIGLLPAEKKPVSWASPTLPSTVLR